MYCSNGHQFAVGKQSPKFCPLCGVSLTNRCPNGHEMAAGVTVCAVCGSAATAPAGSRAAWKASTRRCAISPKVIPKEMT